MHVESENLVRANFASLANLLCFTKTENVQVLAAVFSKKYIYTIVNSMFDSSK